LHDTNGQGRPDVTIALAVETTRLGMMRIQLQGAPAGPTSPKAVPRCHASRVKVYPLSQAANPPPTVFVDASMSCSTATIPYDLRFFQTLDRFVQKRALAGTGQGMIDQLKRLASRRQTIQPDARTQKLLATSARGACLALRSNTSASSRRPS